MTQQTILLPKKKLVFGAHKLHPSNDCRLPITRVVLHELCACLPKVGLSHYDTVMYRALYLTAYYGLFRMGELVAASPNKQTTVAQYRDIIFKPIGGNPILTTITLRHAKNLTHQKPVNMQIDKQVGDWCPVEALVSYKHIRGTCPGPLFSCPAGVGITRYNFNRHLQAVLTRANLPTHLFTGHSFRIGRATDCSVDRMTDWQIRFRPLEV